MSADGDLFRGAVRGVLGLREGQGTAPGDTPELWRLGEYRATVKAAASDGSTVDVEFEDVRLDPMQAVPLRQPFPGCVVVPTAGSVLRVGWEAGREDRPYAGIWESGSATKIVINADSKLYLGGDHETEPVARKRDKTASVTWAVTMGTAAGVAVVVGVSRNGTPLTPAGISVQDEIDEGSDVVESV